MVKRNNAKKRDEESQNKTQNSIKGYINEDTKPKVKYKKRIGTSGATGQLYESRLLSLVLFRCLTDPEVEDFLLGSNVDGVGDLDDICLRFTYRSKQVAAFIQSKHKNDISKGITDSIWDSPKSKVNLFKCFESYLKVLNKFETDDRHIFNGVFKDLTFHFVIYTSAVNKLKKKKIPQNDLEKNDTFNKVKQIISCNSAGDVFQIADGDKDVELLSNFLVDIIANYFVCVIFTSDVFINYANIVVPDVITLTVLNEDYYGGSVNPKFYQATDEALVKFKYKVYEKTLSKSQVNTQYLLRNVQLLLSNDDEFSQRIYLSKLICRYIVFDEKSNKLTFNAKVKKNVVKEYSKLLEQLQVSKVLVNEAFEKAGRELFKSVQFKIPKHVIDIKECNDMISSFTKKINEISKNFFGNLYFYTNQGQAKHVAEKVKEEMAQYLSEKSSYIFTTKTAGVGYLQFHEKIQDWWLLDHRSYFLTETCDYLEKLASEIAEPFVNRLSLSDENFHYSFLFIIAVLLIGSIVDTHKSNIVVVSNQRFGNCSTSMFGNISDSCVEYNDMISYANVTLSDMDHEMRNKILKYKVEFQGQMIRLSALLKNDYSVINASILNRILRNEVITISNRLSNYMYEDIKDIYVQRTFSYRKSDTLFKLNTFKDMSSNINIITAEAGMGKSTVLTHLSIETKKKYPQMWIIRMNLLDYCDEFEEIGTAVNQIEFMKLLLKSEFDDISKFSIKDVGGNVTVEYIGNNDVEALALRIMMDSYIKGDMIFLFDDFDEICPDYITPATNFIKYLIHSEELFEPPKKMTRTFQIWISSRPYNMIVRHLEEQFGAILTLEPLKMYEEHIFFDKYWSLNFEIEKITMEQFNNIQNFFFFMVNFSKHATDIPVTDFGLYKMYETAVLYFRSQIPNILVNVGRHIDKDEILEKWIAGCNFLQMIRDLKKSEDLKKYSLSYTEQTIGVPLYISMAASYFVDEIKTNFTKLPKDWDLSFTTFNYYKRFVELQFKVRFEKKNGMQLSKPDVKSMYNNEQQRFITMHKKLAFHALFHRSEYYEKLLTITDRQYIENTIQDIVEGKEKTGLIGRIHNEVPRFIHFSFTEYFAVEFIVDLILDQQANIKKCTNLTFVEILFDLIIDRKYINICSDCHTKVNIWLEFVVNYILKRGSLGLLTILEKKLEHDGAEINEFLKENVVRSTVLDLIICESVEIESVVGSDGEVQTVEIYKPLKRLMSSEFTNIAMFLIRSFEKNVTKEQVKTYIELFKDGFFTKKKYMEIRIRHFRGC